MKKSGPTDLYKVRLTCKFVLTPPALPGSGGQHSLWAHVSPQGPWKFPPPKVRISLKPPGFPTPVAENFSLPASTTWFPAGPFAVLHLKSVNEKPPPLMSVSDLHQLNAMKELVKSNAPCTATYEVLPESAAAKSLGGP